MTMTKDQNNSKKVEEKLNDKLEKLIEKSKAENDALRKILVGLEKIHNGQKLKKGKLK